MFSSNCFFNRGFIGYTCIFISNRNYNNNNNNNNNNHNNNNYNN